ncbi:helix-turn-helix domain-containing protein [Candidatus Protofrankia californiensis]|uniref:helix-turn-helix domain-containing protein n=1 Tax=Candidatus Protofrankia californiensis TaxID=1839754 RepID=UPI0010417F1D|nr:helix-turn-helix transcriptional regulator [Candidatus Protofrankia californiensis]
MIIGKQLQALRERAGLSYQQAAEAIYASEWTIRRMEKAEVGLKLNNVRGLLVLYGVTDPHEIDAFLGLARDANKPGWWHTYSDVLPAWFRVYVGLEEAASLIRSYEPQAVPGLLQTRDYARALTEAGFPNAPAEEIERRVNLRMTRQELLTRPNAPRLWVVLEETALRRTVGGPDVMAAQLDHLVTASSLPNVTIQVMPFAAGPHPAIYGAFHLLRFPVAELPDIVYGESMTSAFYLDRPEEVASYLEAHDRISAQAVPAEKTATIINTIREER